jgi:thioesterase domain-containing protein
VLYVLPSMGGELHAWHPLVRSLGPDQAVIGLADDPVAGDVTTRAAAWVRLLLDRGPGPCHLAGYSLGAALALEIAQQLRAAGREVGVLAVVDYGPGLSPSPSRRMRSAWHFLANLPHWIRLDLLRSGSASLAARCRRKLAVRARRRGAWSRDPKAEAEVAVDDMFDVADLPERYRAALTASLEAFYRYRLVPYDGSVLLFWARCRPLFHSLSPALGWDAFARGGMRRVVVDCRHDDILKPPHVGAVAEVLRSLLRAGGAATVACDPAAAASAETTGSA